jgi:murein tripeptide amidase MpaA
MKRVSVSIFAAGALLIGMLSAAPAHASPSPPGPARDLPDVYVGDLTADQLKLLNTVGIDQEEDVSPGQTKGGKTHVEIVMGGVEAKTLTARGVPLTLKKVDGKSAAQLAAEATFNVFRPYSGPGNLREEIVKAAADHANIAKVVDFGTTLQGKPMTAIRVSKGVAALPLGKRPVVVYQATQHAREWITPETVRRLLHHFLDNYGKNAEITKLIDTTELWFVPVVNVDGYDLTFQDGFRLWRKNARDNNGDGQITGGDGVDPNRNFPYKWGYDNEGSSSNPASETYRGTGPASEPETRAQLALYQKIKPKYLINYHSAAQLLLHGVGWQTLTRSPDDVIHDALLGDIDHPAVPGSTPELGAQLYTTNGETDGHTDNTFGSLAITPEMATCQTAAGYDPNDDVNPEDCGSVFEFPDNEALVQREFAQNIPFALSAAKSAHSPDDPVSVVGRTTADFETDAFTTSFGGSQKVASVIRRSVSDKRLNYKINGGRTRTADVSEWRGGERYGNENHTYYAEYRGKIEGQRPGDKVEVWFSGKKSRTTVSSAHFTYTVRDQRGAKVLVVADEDYKGVNPTYPAGTNAPKYAQQYVDALTANGVKPLVWDIDKDGVPHDLGVLGHFSGVVWYLGDNRLTQDAADEPTKVGSGTSPDSQVADREKDLVLNTRAYLNEGGKLLYTGETADYFGPLYRANGGGIYFGLKGHPEKPCVVTTNFRDDCELLSDDFNQYWLGAFDRTPINTPTGFTGAGPFAGQNAGLNGTASNPLNEAGGLQVTSTVLPPAQFPQFTSVKAGDYVGASSAFEPVEGAFYVAGTHQDNLYRRLTRTVDLSGVAAAQAPKLQAQLSYSTETGFDHVIVEAHTVGAEDWTTLPEAGGRSRTTVPTECEQGYLLAGHPFLLHYLTGGNPCTNTGSSGQWNSLTGNSNGWAPVTYDLSAYAGKQVSVSITYVSDPGSGGTGLFVDDTKVTTTGGTLDAEGFESGLGPWAIEGAPAGSAPNSAEFLRTQALIDSVSAIATNDTLMWGFGLEQVGTAAERNALMGRAVSHLLGSSR